MRLRRARRSRPTKKKKPARELRQGGSYYRCCIPALAGFARPQSIAPDGERICSQGRQRATAKRYHEHRIIKPLFEIYERLKLFQSSFFQCGQVAKAGRLFEQAGFATESARLTTHCASVCIDEVKWPALLLLLGLCAVATSCTTLVNRRDLYSPEPAPDSLEATRQWYGATTTTYTRTRMPTAEIAASPDFRY